MKATQSSVLIVNHPQVEKVQLGAHCVSRITDVLNELTAQTYSTICISLSDLSESIVKMFIAWCNSTIITPNLILIADTDEKNLLTELINKCSVFKILLSYNDNEFEKHIFSSNEKFALDRQNKQLVQLFNEQNIQLKNLKSNLEDRIKKRKNSLFKSQKRYEALSQNVQALHKSLIVIHKSKTIDEISSQLKSTMSTFLPAEEVKINILDPLDEKSKKNKIILSLIIRQKAIGKITFLLEQRNAPNKDDFNLLSQLAEAVALATERIIKRKESKDLKHQWEATFNAVKEPICIANSNFQIIRTNDNFTKHMVSEQTEINGLNSFEVFFNDSSVLKTAQKLGNSYFFQKTQALLKSNHSKTYDVSVQKIPYIEQENDLWLIYFRDVTEELKLERQILESSKMAELGTISSSIAHELNNPLGGMISFLQLIKMDLNKNDEVFLDIEAMHKSSIRCKDIIENLLGFARQSQGEMEEKINLIELLKQSLKIIELQTKSTNIHLELVAHHKGLMIRGNYNLLTQAFCNILTNSVESIKQKYADQPRYDGQIRIEVDTKGDRVQIIISDNGTGIKPEHQNLVFNPLFTTKNPDHNSGLGLTVSFQIINDHKGTLDIFSQPIAGTAAKISFLRLGLTA